MDTTNRPIDTSITYNFLTADECDFIEGWIYGNVPASPNYHEGPNPPPWATPGEKFLYSNYFNWDLYDQQADAINSILRPRIEAMFPGIYVEQIHLFDSFSPYHIHTDVLSTGRPSAEAPNPAWTLIIPMDTYDSHTITFHQKQHDKEPQLYQANNPPFEKHSIDRKTYERYFTQCSYDDFKWFTMDTIFPWIKGSLFAASRWCFHTSDNFIANGIKNKRALIAWTCVPWETNPAIVG